MNFSFHDKGISGLLLVLPANERRFVDDMREFNFPEARSLKLKEVMGYDRRRVVGEGVCTSDLAVHGFDHLFREGLIGRDDFDALVVVTQTPDYFLPPTSNVIQGRLGLKTDILCLDINQGCAGFVVGLIEAFLLLEQDSIRRVALVNGDVLSRKVSSRDRSSYPLVGDAASIALVERRPGAGTIPASLKMDGSRREALIIPAGGLRLPSSPATSQLEDAGDNNLRAKDHLRMDGSAVFNFVQVDVPPMVSELLARAGVGAGDVDYFVFHQPNRFMLEKLAEKMRVPAAKVPSNVVENYGNSTGTTIPTALVHNLREPLLAGSLQLCLAGFGVGLTWAAMYLRTGPFDFCEVIEYPQ